MRILYYTWNENSYHDMHNALTLLGHTVLPVSYHLTDYNNDNGLSDHLLSLNVKSYDCIFSFDFFPVLSDIAQELSVPYASWVYDCPHYTLYSKSILNPVNRIAVFDKEQLNALQRLGCHNVFHLPLAANCARLNSLLGPMSPAPLSLYRHDVSFVGSLYEQNMYDKISYLPPYIRGYINGLISSQQMVQGINFPGELISDEMLNDIVHYVKFDFGEGYFPISRRIITDLINTKITSVERITLLNHIAGACSLALYTGSDASLVPDAESGGYISYTSAMPQVFRNSRINLNISLRSITSGIPLRAVDIMAAGGFLLSNYQPELDEYFINGTDCVLYTQEDELLYYIDYYLTHEEERAAIAYNGWRKIQEGFDYPAMIKLLLQGIIS